MKNLILRYKMYRLLTKMLDAERSGKTMLSACNLPKDKGILFALHQHCLLKLQSKYSFQHNNN